MVGETVREYQHRVIEPEVFDRLISRNWLVGHFHGDLRFIDSDPDIRPTEWHLKLMSLQVLSMIAEQASTL